ncbi:MAG: hypothetical protein ACFFC7_32485 [Candidatus Hermodarchaeota archaeon]
MEKKIIPSFNPIVNLLLHAICCFDDSFPRKPIYAEKAEEWLISSEKKFFADNFRLEQTGKVSSTAQFALLFQIPAYFSTDTLNSLKEVIDLMKNQSLSLLKQHFPKKGALIDRYTPKQFQALLFEESIKKQKNCEEVLDKYAEILENVYERFYIDYWKTLLPDVNQKIKLLHEEYFKRTNLIELWERKSRLEFPYPTFVVELADPISSLGTSLMAERDAFSSWVNIEKLITLISHEIGTHIFFQTYCLQIPEFTAIFNNNAEKTIRIIEAFSSLLNLDIGKELNWPIGYSKQFTDIFKNEVDALHHNWSDWQTGNLSAPELIIRAFKHLQG